MQLPGYRFLLFDNHDSQLQARKAPGAVEDVSQVVLYDLGLDAEALADLLVREAIGNQKCYLTLSRGQDL
jgi:hypothetical protein